MIMKDLLNLEFAMEIKGDDLIFSSGTIVKANRGIIGLTRHGDLTEGYDSGLWRGDMDEYDEIVFTPEERVELANYMLVKWEEFRGVAEKECGAVMKPLYFWCIYGAAIVSAVSIVVYALVFGE